MAVDMKDYFGKGQNNTPPPQTPDFIKNFGKNASMIYIIVGVILLLVVARPFAIINSGEVGILVTLGKFEKEPIYPGFHLVTPFVQKVITVDTRVRMVNFSKDESLADKKGITSFGAISVLDARGLPVDVELSVQYSIKPEMAPLAIASLGLNWEDKVINSNARDVIRSVVGNFTAEELPVKRNTIAQLINQGMSSAIEKVQGKPVLLTSIQLRNIVLPDKVKEQIERVQIANQEAEKAKYDVEKARQVAEAKRMEAQGVADSARIAAEGQAKANSMISHSLSNNLIRLRQVEAQQKFNEALAVNKDAKIFLTPGGAVPNIWVDMKSDKERASSQGGH